MTPHANARGVHRRARRRRRPALGSRRRRKLTKKLAAARLNVATREGSDPEEIAALKHAVALFQAEAELKKAVKEAQAALDLVTLKKYGDLDEEDIQALVLDDKWKATTSRRVENVLTLLVLDLVGRLQELGERYGETLGSLDAELAIVSARVTDHLAQIGVT